MVDAAVALVEREGPQALGFNRVAQELGIKPPSLYNHVANYDDLRRAVAIAGWCRLRDDLAIGAVPGAEGVRRLADAFRAFVHAHPALYQVMATTLIPQAEATFQPVAAEVMALFADVLAPFGSTGEALVHAVRGLRAALHGFVLLELAGQFGMPASVDESFRYLVASLIAGLQASPR